MSFASLDSLLLSVTKVYMLDFNPTKCFTGTPHVSSFFSLTTELFELL